ncbi:MAG: hypothetical protein IT381_28010 [Deltaproteobacteria bacterium]|nr:hypothetical protein [Deltaproteobacteria bacterium]
MSHYGIAHLVHLLCGISFIGVVFFEIVILEGMRKPLGPERMADLELALINRAKRIMPWVVASLFVSGVVLATHHRVALSQLARSSFGALLALKILLALSVLGHFVYALTTASDGCMNSRKFKLLHVSVGTHMLLIVVLAKAMFYVAN